MASVIQHSFRALITFDPSARESLVLGFLDGTRTTCVIQPCSGMYFPALLARHESPRPRLAMDARLSIPLHSGETETFFAPGQRFIIWADAIVGRTIRGDGLVGHGVISAQESLTPPSALTPQPRNIEVRGGMAATIPASFMAYGAEGPIVSPSGRIGQEKRVLGRPAAARPGRW